VFVKEWSRYHIVECPNIVLRLKQKKLLLPVAIRAGGKQSPTADGLLYIKGVLPKRRNLTVPTRRSVDTFYRAKRAVSTSINKYQKTTMHIDDLMCPAWVSTLRVKTIE
jgi:hypothetical protein